MTVRIMIADDHAMVRDGLKLILEAEDDLAVVGMAEDGRDAIVRAATLRPDIIVMDIAMPQMNGIEATGTIRRSVPEARVIILSMHQTREHIHRAMQAGAQGYILKESAGTEVVKAVRAVMKGHRYFGNGLDLPTETPSLKSPLDSLSRREREVLQLVVEGKTSAEIAEALSLSPKSVETYRSRLMLKLGITNIPSLVKFALQHGITPAN